MQGVIVYLEGGGTRESCFILMQLKPALIIRSKPALHVL
jgi:hypothetical protein